MYLGLPYQRAERWEEGEKVFREVVAKLRMYWSRITADEGGSGSDAVGVWQE